MMNLVGSDLSLVQITFIADYLLYAFDVVGDVSSDALKRKLIYL